VLALASGLALGLAPVADASSGVGSTPPFGPLYASDPLPCTDDNLGSLARATGGEIHALVKEGECLIVHKFTSDGTFTLDAGPNAPMQTFLLGAGGGGGGGSGWEDSTKASGAEPESGAGAGGAGGSPSLGTVFVDPTTGYFTYTPSSPGDLETSESPAHGAFLCPSISVPVTVGIGGTAGTAGSSTAGSTVGGQGGTGGTSTFGDIVATGGTGGFGGTGAEGSQPGVQFGMLGSPRAGGYKGGSNAAYAGGIGSTSEFLHAAPGGAGAAGNGFAPVSGATAPSTGNGGNGGLGFADLLFQNGSSPTPTFGSGGGGGTISPGSPPFAAVTGGTGGPEGFGGSGGAGGDGQDALDGFGGGGGGGGTDGSVTVGDSNAGKGGRGGDGVVYVRYAARKAPAKPQAPVVTPGDGSVTVTIPLLDVVAEYYTVWVENDPTKVATIYPPQDSVTLDGLENGTSYTIRVSAGNAAGYSEPSDASPAVVPTADVLPYTGSNSRNLAAMALTMIGLGGGFTALARRRRTIG
jgi:LPXTG-motif cell wall-anchored protein